MTEVMMILGSYQFSLDAAAYQNLRRSARYRWPAQERFGRLPARQFTGPGDETLEMTGNIYPHFRGGLEQLEQMREVAGQGRPLQLTDGRGRAWGKWCIVQVDETSSYFWGDGAPRKIEFRLGLARYGEDG